MYVIVAVYVPSLIFVLCIETLVGHVMCPKELIAAMFNSSEPLRLNGYPYIESTGSV